MAHLSCLSLVVLKLVDSILLSKFGNFFKLVGSSRLPEFGNFLKLVGSSLFPKFGSFEIGWLISVA